MAEALSIGPVAWRILAAPGPARIVAHFARSLHMEADGVILCCVTPDLGKGPLNITVPIEILEGMRALPHTARFERRAGAAYSGDVPVLRWKTAARWQPPPRKPFVFPTSEARWHFASALRKMALPAGSFLFADRNINTDFFLKAASQRMAAFGRWLAKAEGPVPAAPLVGLGQGLTPSGDDFIGGAMMALSHWGPAAMAAALREAIGNIPDGATTPVSASLLRAAAEGFAHEYIHAMLDAIDAGSEREIQQAIVRAATIGHLSGWDTLAGIAIALDALSIHCNNMSVSHPGTEQAA